MIYIFSCVEQQLQRAVLNTLLPSCGESWNFPTLTSSTSETAQKSCFISKPVNLYLYLNKNAQHMYSLLKFLKCLTHFYFVLHSCSCAAAFSATKGTHVHLLLDQALRLGQRAEGCHPGSPCH